MIGGSGRLRVGRSSCEGKHLACTREDARRWGRMLHGAGAFALLQVTMPDVVAARLFRWEHLDGIGPARFATIDELEEAQVAEVTHES